MYDFLIEYKINKKFLTKHFKEMKRFIKCLYIYLYKYIEKKKNI